MKKNGKEDHFEPPPCTPRCLEWPNWTTAMGTFRAFSRFQVVVSSLNCIGTLSKVGEVGLQTLVYPATHCSPRGDDARDVCIVLEFNRGVHRFAARL